jgi:hypothetical protein
MGGLLQEGVVASKGAVGSVTEDEGLITIGDPSQPDQLITITRG